MARHRKILKELVAGNPLDHLGDSSVEVRRLAVAASERLGTDALAPLSLLAASDPSDDVRAEAVEVLGTLGPAAFDPVMAAAADPAIRVKEAAATALGEIANPAAVPWLLETIAGDGEPLVQEAAIASLGAIGDTRALPALLDTVRAGKPQLRRRSVVALTAFDGPEVEAALTGALLDRNPMVREVAEMVLGRPPPISRGNEGRGTSSEGRATGN